MDPELSEELQRLKNEMFEREKAHHNERACLCKLVHTLALVMSRDEAMTDEVRVMRELTDTDDSLPTDLIEKEILKLKDKILSEPREPASGKGSPEEFLQLKERLLEACRQVRKMIAALVKDFYPLSPQLKAMTSGIGIDCNEKANHIQFREATEACLKFTEGLRAKIEEDFRYINQSFFILLENVKNLERNLSNELGGEDRVKQIEYFEMEINHEVGSIASSFDIHKTINEVKNVVLAKIKNIRQMVALRKEEEIRKTKLLQVRIQSLKDRIVHAEKDARVMSQRAEQLQMVAMKDGLTGLYNRKAFDVKIRNAFKALTERGEPFSLILFDVDRFKTINDTYGHVAGDKVLEKVAQSLRETFREGDFVGRYGGDEFVVVIERLTGEMAEEKICHFRRNLAKRRFVSHKRGKVDITVSAGIAAARQGDSPEALLERADRAMYTEKHGENSVL